MRTLIILMAASLATLSGWTQSLVQFQNSVTFVTTADRLIYTGGLGGPVLAGTNYVVGLWYIPGAGHGSEIASPTAGTQAGGTGFMRSATSSGVKGQWLNPVAIGNTRTLDNVSAGTYATLQVRVWDIDKYATFAQAFVAGEYGWSTPFDWKAPVPGDPPTGMYMDNFRAFVAFLAPEPSLILPVALLGTALLWKLRRRV